MANNTRQVGGGAVEIVLLVLLASLWSSSFTFIKVAVETVPPLSVAAGRLLLGSVIFLAVLRLRGLSLPRDWSIWARFLSIGLFANALPFTLIGWGEQTIDSGLAAILMAVMPLTTLLLAHFFTWDEKLNTPRIAGMLLGFTGVAILIGPAVLKGLGDQVLGQAAVAGGAVCYAIATIMAKRLPRMPDTVNAACMVIGATLLLTPVCLLVDRPWTLSPPPEALVSIGYLGAFPTALAGLVFFTLLRRTGATFVALNNYLIPGLGVMWGVIFLGEALSLQSMAALAIILSGIAVARLAGAKTDSRQA